MKKTLQTLVYGTIAFVLTGLFQNASAQVSMTALGTAYTQNFNGLPTSGSTTWTNNSTLANWYADRTTGSGSMTMYADNGSSSTNTIYSYGSGSDRALGAAPGEPGVGSVSYGLRMKNNTGSTIKAFTISFTAEQWRSYGAATKTILFSYSTSTSAITDLSGTYTSFTSLDFQNQNTGSTGALDGNLAANSESKSFTITGLSLANGSEIMFKWYMPKETNISHGYAIDDVSVTPLSPAVYYSKSTGYLNVTSNWGTNTDGSGTNPSDFHGDNTIYVVSNNTTPTLSANWEIEGTNSKIIVGTGSAINLTLPSGTETTGSIDVATNATLTISCNLMPTIGSRATVCTIVFNNSASQSIPAGNYYNLTINGGGTKTIAGDIRIGGTLTFTSGKLQLGTGNLTIASNGSISGASSSNYIITNGTGYLKRQVVSNSGNIAYPIGTSSSYTPVTLSQTNAGTTDNFWARVYSGAYTAYNTSDVATGTAITSHVVKNTWAIGEQTTGGSNVSITLQWNASDEGTSFTRSSSSVLHYTGGAWTTGSYSAASGTGPYTRQITGITSFSPFGVGDNVAALPVEWLSFDATDKASEIELNWATASEKNNKGFEVERKDESTADFIQIGFVQGHNTSSVINTYNYSDYTAKGKVVYYRLKQVDQNGEFAYSAVVAVERKSLVTNSGDIKIYPNPAVNNIAITVSDANQGSATLNITDLSGRVVMTRSFDSDSGFMKINQELDLAAGTYVVMLVQGENIRKSKLVIQ